MRKGDIVKMAITKKVKVDCRKVLVDLDGTDMNLDDGKAMTVGRMIAISLMNNPDKKDSEKILDRYELAMHMNNSEEYELSEAETREIESSLAFGTTIVGGQIIKYIRECKEESRKGRTKK